MSKRQRGKLRPKQNESDIDKNTDSGDSCDHQESVALHQEEKVRLWILFGTAAATAVSAIFAPEKLTAMMNLLRELLANEP